MHHDTFNVDFYITAAAVLPVLYLALVFEGSTYRKLLKRADEIWEAGKLYELYLLWRLLAYALWILWATGEILSIYSLYYGVALAGPLVLLSLVGLVIAVTAGPALTFWTSAPRPGRGESQKP
jgi:hypothetical protein